MAEVVARIAYNRRDVCVAVTAVRRRGARHGCQRETGEPSCFRKILFSLYVKDSHQKKKMISRLARLPPLPGRLMISVLPGFRSRVDMWNEQVKPLRKFLQVPFKIRIPVLWLPLIPPDLASGAMRIVVS